MIQKKLRHYAEGKRCLSMGRKKKTKMLLTMIVGLLFWLLAWRRLRRRTTWCYDDVSINGTYQSIYWALPGRAVGGAEELFLDSLEDDKLPTRYVTNLER